jgi:hypothetical protein
MVRDLGAHTLTDSLPCHCLAICHCLATYHCLATWHFGTLALPLAIAAANALKSTRVLQVGSSNWMAWHRGKRIMKPASHCAQYWQVE